MTEFVVTVVLVDATASTRGSGQIALHWTDVAFHGACPVASVSLPRSGRQVAAERDDRGSVGLRWDPVRS